MGGVCGDANGGICGDAVVEKTVDKDYGRLSWHLRSAKGLSGKEIEQRGAQWAADIMKRCDKDGNMTVDRDEANALNKEVFAYLRIAEFSSDRVQNGLYYGVEIQETTGYNYLVGQNDEITKDRFLKVFTEMMTTAQKPELDFSTFGISNGPKIVAK